MRRFLMGVFVVASPILGGPAPLVVAAGLDEFSVRQALFERFDENRNDKLESLEAKQARTRLRNLLEDKSDREISIHTWREDVKRLLNSLDSDEDNRLTASERTAGVKLLERLIPKVEMNEGNDKSKSSLGSSSEKKSGSNRPSSSGHGSSSSSGYIGPWSTNRGPWGWNGGWGLGMNGFGHGGSFGTGQGLGSGFGSIGAARSSSFFSGSGLENANPLKGDLGTTTQVDVQSADQAHPNNPLSDSPTAPESKPFESTNRAETSPNTETAQSGKTKPMMSPDPLAAGAEMTGAGKGDSPAKPSVGSSSPTLIPPMPRPGF